MSDIFNKAFVYGVVAGTIIFVLSMMSLFMVFGDGTAPTFTHVMLGLNEFPYRIFSMKKSEHLLVVGAIFWAVVVALLVLVLQILRKGK